MTGSDDNDTGTCPPVSTCTSGSRMAGGEEGGERGEIGGGEEEGGGGGEGGRGYVHFTSASNPISYTAFATSVGVVWAELISTKASLCVRETMTPTTPF